jgi:hypothetical protein
MSARNGMRSRQERCDAAWEAATSQHPVEHRRGKRVTVHPFRRYGDAIAWVEWLPSHASLLKIERLDGASSGSGSALLKLIQKICVEHGLALHANVAPYRREPDGEIVDDPHGSARLIGWYRWQGFDITKADGAIHAWYRPNLSRP